MTGKSASPPRSRWNWPYPCPPAIMCSWRRSSPARHRGRTFRPSPPATPPPCRRAAATSSIRLRAFGMGVYLYRYSDPEQMDRAAQIAQDIGVKWSREEFYWGAIERRRRASSTGPSTTASSPPPNATASASTACWTTGPTGQSPTRPKASRTTAATSGPSSAATRTTSTTGRSGTSPTSSSGRAPRTCTPTCSRRPTRRSRRWTPRPRWPAARPPASTWTSSGVSWNWAARSTS